MTSILDVKQNRSVFIYLRISLMVSGDFTRW